MIEYLLLAVLIITSNFLCYQLGKTISKRDHDKKTIQSVLLAREIRNTLHDPDVVDQLQRKYKR